MITIFNFFSQIYLKRQRKRSAIENHLHIHPVHRVQSQTSDFIFMLLSIIVIRLISKQKNILVTKIVHLKVRNIIEEVLNLRNGYLNEKELWTINYLMSCNAAEWCSAVVERYMQECPKYCTCSEDIRLTCAVSSISSISSMTLTYMWSKGVHACSIHVTRAISFALVNICKIINIKKKKIVIGKKLPSIT